ncbi:N-acyl-D-glucosamine 2-epimerase [Bifidobacterium sp. DSM 109959]|uniref:N-acyl-D-glucosamine 2-epimerase n=1 Tax=Bifidobacterium olomucense TaxID=2675324 RepID=A0A7Y0HXC3_9BIFI|nr:N-acyl-D-glucosamine 2-epimerase [Bifidobacterium sp. DSM 109959]
MLTEAQKTFLDRFWDDETGLSVDTWNEDFTELDRYRGLNANMHSVEAFLAVADVTGDESWRTRAGRIIDHVLGWASNNEWRTPEHFHEDWSLDLECNADRKGDQFKPYGATPGHGIEWSRLITQYALSAPDLSESDKARLVDAAENLFHRAVADGWNIDGAPGIVYTTDWQGRPVVHDRMHWTLAEAINTSATLARVTGRPEYGEWYSRFLAYADDKVIDHDNGSWFHQLDAGNHPIGTVWPGKSDLYHATQSMMIPLHDPSLSIAVAAKRSAD